MAECLLAACLMFFSSWPTIAFVTPEAPTRSKRPTIADKIPLFITAKRSAGRGEVTLDKYETELPRFEQFMKKRSKFYPEDITTDDLIAYQGTWDELYPSKLTRAKVQERLKSFVRFACTVAHAAEVLDKSKFQAIKIKKSDHQKADPFTKAEESKMLAKIPVVFPGSDIDLVKLRGRLTALIHLMVSTGIAITDACRLRKADFENGCSISIAKRPRRKFVFNWTQHSSRNCWWSKMATLNMFSGTVQPNCRL